MRLRRPCIHDRYEDHPLYEPLVAGRFIEAGACPGGEFLPEDALVIEKDFVGEAWMESTGDHTLSGWWTGHPISEGPFYLIPKDQVESR